MTWGDWEHGSWKKDGWESKGSWKDGPGWDKRWQETSPAAKDPADWSKYTYLNGGPKATHTVPPDQRAWLIREMMSKVQDEDEDKVKLPVLKTLRWSVNSLDAALYIFCGIGRRMAIGSVGKSRDAVLAACVEGFLNKWQDADERRQIMVKVTELADKEETLLETAVEDGFNYEPEAPPARPGAAAPGAAGGSAGAGGSSSNSSNRILQRQSTPDLISQLEKRRKIADMEKEAALAESAAMAARHAAANERMWQQGQAPATPVQATQAAPPGSTLASVEHALFAAGEPAGGAGVGAKPPAAAPPPGATAATAAAAAPGATAAKAAAAVPGQPQQPQSQQPQAEAGHDAEEQALQAASLARRRLLGTAGPSATDQQPPSSAGAGQGAGSRPAAQENLQKEAGAQAMVQKLAELAAELMQTQTELDEATAAGKQLKAMAEEAMCARSEAEKQEQEAMRLLAVAGMEETALRSQVQLAETQQQESMRLLAEAGVEEQAIRSRAQGLQELAEAKCAEAAAESGKWEQAARDAELKHLSEMKDLEMQAQSCKHALSMQEVSLKAEVTQLRTELQNAEREAHLHGEMQSMEMQAEQAKCSALRAELEEAKNSDE